jgi:hypothetical protein
MPTVTLDTILAERADVGTLIDTALRQGWDVAVVELRQADWPALTDVPVPEGYNIEIMVGRQQVPDPQSPWEGLGPLEILGPETWFTTFAQLHRIVDSHGSERMAEPAGMGLKLTFSPEAIDPFTMSLISAQRSWGREELFWEFDQMVRILHIISQGAFAQESFSPAFTPVQQRQLREAASLLVHVCARRDIFVTDNTNAFVHHRHRLALWRLLTTRIMTADEFFACLAGTSRNKKPRRT